MLGVAAPIIGALLISIALHIAAVCLYELIAEGMLKPGDIFTESAAALSFMCGLSTLLAGTILAFSVPGGLVMRIILVAFAILGFGRLL
jgi:hypothetical protein